MLVAMKCLVLIFFLPISALANWPIQSEIERTSVQFFLDHAHPRTGLIRDKASNFKDTPSTNRVASIASTGFGLAVLANAAKRGLLDRREAEERILKALLFARDHVPRRNGWFLHWVDWETGLRAWKSEYSPIDTALFMAGALYAAQVFPGGQIQAISSELYQDMDFADYLTDGGAKPFKKTMSLSYSDEKGFEPYQWNIYAEQKILLLLGLGHPTRPISKDVWHAWLRFHSPRAILSGIMGHEMPLFIHQYSSAFIDFRELDDGHRNYHHNSYRASLLHRDLRAKAKTLTMKKGFWGLSAGEDPEGYKVYGPTDFKGTVCIGCAIASAMFLPGEVMWDATQWKQGEYKGKIWGRYGFSDSLDLDRNWFSQTVIGITVGPAYMSLANMKPQTSIWSDFMQIPAIKRAIRKIHRPSGAVP